MTLVGPESASRARVSASEAPEVLEVRDAPAVPADLVTGPATRPRHAIPEPRPLRIVASPPRGIPAPTRGDAVAPALHAAPTAPLETITVPQPGRPAPRPVTRTRSGETTLEKTSGRLVIDTSFSRLSPQLGSRCVTVRVDGFPLRFAWGRTPIDLPAGRHRVEIEVEPGRLGAHPWGPITDAVPVAPGHAVEVFYRAPALPRMAGTLGPSRQGTPGHLACVALLALLGALITLLAVLGATALL